MQNRCAQVLREVFQHLPLPCRGAKLSFRTKEDLRARDEDSSQEGQEVQLYQGLQGAAKGDLRPMREKVSQTGLRNAAEIGVCVYAQGGVQRRGQAVLSQGREGRVGRR